MDSIAFADSVECDQTAQNVQSDLRSSLSDKEAFKKKHTHKKILSLTFALNAPYRLYNTIWVTPTQDNTKKNQVVFQHLLNHSHIIFAEHTNPAFHAQLEDVGPYENPEVNAINRANGKAITTVKPNTSTNNGDPAVYIPAERL